MRILILYFDKVLSICRQTNEWIDLERNGFRLSKATTLFWWALLYVYNFLEIRLVCCGMGEM